MSVKFTCIPGLLALAALVGCGGGSSAPAPAPAPAAPAPAAPVSAPPPGSIAGVVKFDGDAPVPNPVKMTGDAACAGGKGRVSEDFVVADGKLANVFVYLKEGVDLAKAPAADPALVVELDQQGCWYTPHVIGVRVGQKVVVKNSDPTMHNVHGLGAGAFEFNEGMSQGAPPFEFVADAPQMGVKVKCDVHAWMTSWFNVMEHPWFAVSKPDGSFEIKGVPDGDYTVHFWHEKLGEQTATVKVAGGAVTTEATFKAK